MLSPVPIRLDNDSYYCGERQRADNGASEHPEASRNMLRRAKPDETGWGWRDKPHSVWCPDSPLCSDGLGG